MCGRNDASAMSLRNFFQYYNQFTGWRNMNYGGGGYELWSIETFVNVSKWKSSS